MIEADFLILGGGLGGLSAAIPLAERAVVLEREARPGGLVRTAEHDGWLFDHVVHLLYFPDQRTEECVRRWLGSSLAPCAPVAWVHSMSGITRFPFQAHLAPLPTETIVSCLASFAEAQRNDTNAPAENYEQMLLRTFGREMCEEFFFPYNRKMWKRPLSELAGSGFHWNIARPDLREVLRGALEREHQHLGYNARGWYPRVPERHETPRGMEALSHALAQRVARLHTGVQVTGIDPRRRRVFALEHGTPTEFAYRRGVISTLPLPLTAALMQGLSNELIGAGARLRCNRVLTPCLRIRGPRPENSGHWRYYAAPDLSFTRLMFMTKFDPDSAPADGWGLMAEITQPNDAPLPDPKSVLARVCREVRSIDILPPGSDIVGAELIVNPYGYVVFEPGTAKQVEQLSQALRSLGVEPLGRYGRWEYSSMGQVMRDGLELGERAANDAYSTQLVAASS
ncbi:MAG: NAD(P)-binding protein [Polyangiaceae bacterium]